MKHLESGNGQVETSRVTSLRQLGGEGVQITMPPSPLAADHAVEMLHDLGNAFASVLLNAQVLDGKMPSYSRAKRYVHEIERSAQRGGALLKRLLERFPAEPGGAGESELGFREVPPVVEPKAVVANQGPAAAAEGAFDFAPSAAAHAAPAFSSRLGAHRGV